MQERLEERNVELPFTLIKAGFMTYRREELGIEGGPEFLRLYYPKELLAKDCVIKSFCYQPITMEHEGGFTANESPFVRGMVSKTWFNPSTESIEGIALITDAELIHAIESGKKVEISGGWFLDMTPYGEDYVCTQMEGNHVSVVKQGRCGEFCHIKASKKEGGMSMKKEEEAKENKESNHCGCKEALNNDTQKTHWVYNRALSIKNDSVMEERIERLEALIQTMQDEWSNKVEDIRGLSQKVESLNGLDERIEEHKNHLKQKSQENTERLRQVAKQEYRKKDKSLTINEAFTKFYGSN